MKLSDLSGVKLVSSPTISTAAMNNPFNIKVGGATDSYIQSGQASVGRAAPDGGNFLTFKDRNAAIDAAKGLLFNSGVYKGLTVDAALKKWSNNGYGGNVIPSLAGKDIDSLTPDEQTQVLNAMEMKGENDAVPEGTMRVSNFKPGQLSLVQPTAPAPAKPATPPQSGFEQTMSATKDFAKGARDTLAAPVLNAGELVQEGLDQTVGRGINLVLGKGNKPTSENNALNPESPEGQKAQAKLAAPVGTAGEVGKVVGTVAPYLTGVGEETGAAAGAKALEATGSKVVGWLAEHIPTFAANTAIGTAQTKDIKSGAEQAGVAEVGQAALSKITGYIAAKGERLTKNLTTALTPRLVGKGYTKAAQAGTKITEPSIFGKAGVDGDTIKTVQRSVQAVQNVAAALGKKATDIIKSGSGQITKNFNRVNDAISEYSKNVVTPFLKKAGVNYNFADLKGALEVVKPTADLKGAALKTYNEVRQQILSAVAGKVSPEVKGGKSLTALRGMASDTGTVPGKVTDGDKDFWDARKIIDDIGNEATKGNIFGSPEHSGASKAWADIRAAYKNYLSDGFRYPGQMENVNRANEFLQTQQASGMDKTGWDISKFEGQFGLTPNPASHGAAQEWDTHMGNLEGLYQGRTNLGTGLGTERGKTATQLWAEAHPKTVGTAKKVLGTAATAAGLGAGYGVFEKVMGGSSPSTAGE